MPKRKRSDERGSVDTKAMRIDLKGPFNDPLLRESVALSIQNTKRSGQSRKDKRKEAKLLRKMRKDAFHQRKAIPTKEDFLKAKKEIALDEKKEREKKRKKEQKKKQKKEKKRKKQIERKKIEEKEQQEADELEAVKQRDDREIRDLEKKLHLNKRKTKTLPQAFLNDGLDYILDVVDSEKLEAMADLGQESGEICHEKLCEDILDVVDSEKLEAMDDLGEEYDLEDEFKSSNLEDGDIESENSNGDVDMDDFGSDLDEEGGGDDDDDDDFGGFDEEDGDVDDDFDSLKDEKEDVNERLNKRSEISEELTEDVSEDGKRKAKWEKLAEKIQKVVKKKSEKTSSIIKHKSENVNTEEKMTEKSDKVKKKVSFADEVEEKEFGSETSSNVEHTDSSVEIGDSDSVNSGESGEGAIVEEKTDQDDENSDAVESHIDDIYEMIESQKGEFDEFNESFGMDLEDTDDLKEDIYGRLRDSKGNIVKDNKGAGGGTQAYIPPAKRAQMIAGSDEKRRANLEKLRKQMKGLVNRASEANLQSVSSQIEELYLSNSRADVNETFVDLVFDLCVTKEMTPERLSMELMMLVAILHGNVGSEVGAHFLQRLVKKFDVLYKGEGHTGKELDNVVTLLSHLYNFKVVHGILMFDLLKLLTDQFLEKDVELILLTVKNIGFTLRKDDPNGLKDFIMNVQTKASSSDVTGMRDQSRVRFMLDVLLAIRNNNMRKIPNYDPEHLQHLQKSMKGFLRGGDFGDNQLHVTLQDLINAENKGKWWIVGSAWEGQGPKQPLKEQSSDASILLHGIEISAKLQSLAKKQRMNTDKRRTIFYIIMTSEDYIDAFQKLLRMGLKANQQQEIVVVILDCCLQEKSFNPFYAFLAQKFCEHHRSYQMSFQFSIWDRFKTISDLSDSNRQNFGKLLTHLLINKSLSLSILKVIEFGTVQKSMVRLLKQVLTEILTEYPLDKTEAVFTRIAPLVKLRKLHEGLKLFMHHFLIGRKKDSQDIDPVLRERIDLVDQILSLNKGHML